MESVQGLHLRKQHEWETHLFPVKSMPESQFPATSPWVIHSPRNTHLCSKDSSRLWPCGAASFLETELTLVGHSSCTGHSRDLARLAYFGGIRFTVKGNWGIGSSGKLPQVAQAGSSGAVFKPRCLVWTLSRSTAMYLYLLSLSHQTLTPSPPQLLQSCPALPPDLSPYPGPGPPSFHTSGSTAASLCGLPSLFHHLPSSHLASLTLTPSPHHSQVPNNV